MKFNGKVLKQTHLEGLLEATEIFNRLEQHRNPNHVAITPEVYLEQLINAQLDGLVEGVKSQKNLEEFQRLKEEAARRRLNI